MLLSARPCLAVLERAQLCWTWCGAKAATWRQGARGRRWATRTASSATPAGVHAAEPVIRISEQLVELGGDQRDSGQVEEAVQQQKPVRLSKDGTVDRRTLPKPVEVRVKISESNKGKKRSAEARRRISEGAKQRSLESRANHARARLGSKHTEETKAKIAASVRATKAAQRLARAGGDQRAAAARQGDRAARSAPAGPASALGPLAGAPTREQEALSELAFEKAVFEMTALRRELNAWMGAFEKAYGYQPDMNNTAKTHPEVYKRFVRYVALRELVRQGR